MTGYLEQYDAAADGEKWRLVRGWIDNDALPFFEELRERRPVLVTPECTLVARYDDVIEALNMPQIFTVALYLPKMRNGIYLMAHDDDALHYREKSIMQGLLNRDDLPRVRAMVRETGARLLDNAGGSIEAIKGFTRLVPATLVQDYFGLKGCDVGDLMDWSYWNQVDTFYNQPFDLRTDAERRNITDNHNRVNDALSKFVEMLILRRGLEVKAEQAANLLIFWWFLIKRWLAGGKREEATDDIVSRMLRTSYPDEMNFDIQRVGINIGGLLIGTVETTSQATAQVIEFFLQRPELLSDARQAAREAGPRFDGFVWEALRYVPISPYMFRQLSCDYTIGNGEGYATTVPKGTNVLVLTQSAMFDARAYDNADAFVPDRNWYNHFAFGYGSHECLGKWVGSVMIPEMVRQVLLRRNLRQLGPIDYKGEHLPQEYHLAWAA